MKTFQIALFGSVVALALTGVLGGCGDASSSDASSTTATKKKTSDKGQGSFNGSGASAATSLDCSENQEGCACDEAGAVASCWTGPPEDRQRGTCRDGRQTCTRTGEFLLWGFCEDQMTNCDGVKTVPAQPCEGDCVPGATRWCDEPVFCSWGKQECTPQRTWGPCRETPDTPKGCERVGSRQYDPFCCVRVGECCQDVTDTANAPNFGSKGNCENIACRMSKK
ncbi:MAG TPA: hypothetical protein VM925_08445 [Labilithrix sp.]|nr:hypothetical protein [Labilithrix sp.]